MTEPPKNTSLDATLNWWRALQTSPGHRARLRRAKSLEEIVMTPAFHELRHALRPTGWKNVSGIAVLAGVLAWVETDARQHRFGQQLADKLTELRFRRLLQIKDHDAIYLAMTRTSKHLKKTANLADLIPFLYWWSPRSRRDLAMAYYDAAGTTTESHT